MLHVYAVVGQKILGLLGVVDSAVDQGGGGHVVDCGWSNEELHGTSDCACEQGGGEEVDVYKGYRWLLGLQAVGYNLWVHVGLLVVWGFHRFCYVVGSLK